MMNKFIIRHWLTVRQWFTVTQPAGSNKQKMIFLVFHTCLPRSADIAELISFAGPPIQNPADSESQNKKA